MIKFARKRYCTNPGSRFRTVFKLCWDTNTGAEELRAIGKEDWQGMIQASSESCDLNKIIARVRNGEVNLLNMRQALYADVTSTPMTLQELLQTRIDARHMWDNLPEQVKKNFESMDDFLGGAGEKVWLEKLGFKFDEVKDDGSAAERGDSETSG